MDFPSLIAAFMDALVTQPADHDGALNQPFLPPVGVHNDMVAILQPELTQDAGALYLNPLALITSSIGNSVEKILYVDSSSSKRLW